MKIIYIVDNGMAYGHVPIRAFHTKAAAEAFLALENSRELQECELEPEGVQISTDNWPAFRVTMDTPAKP